MTAHHLLCELCAYASTASCNIMKIWLEWHCLHCSYCPPCSWALIGPGHAGSIAFSDSAAAAGPSDGLSPTLLCIPCQDSRAGQAAIRHFWCGKQQQGATQHAGIHLHGSCSCCCSSITLCVCLTVCAVRPFPVRWSCGVHMGMCVTVVAMMNKSAQLCARVKRPCCFWHDVH